MTIDNLINWLQEAEDNNTWLVSTQSVKRHLEKIKKTEQLTLTDVSQQRELLIAELNKTDLEYIHQQGCTDILAEDLLRAIYSG